MAKWQENNVTSLWKMYEEGISYQVKTGLRQNIPKYVDFYEGRQWPEPTEATKNLPRPVINIIKMICRSKKSSILSTPVRISYKSYSNGTDTDKLNSFAQSMLKELDQDGQDRLAIDDGIKKGSYFYHYYWDKSAISQTGHMEGGVRCEIIDPLNIFFSNPAELDEQKQKWILISTPMDKEEICAICDKDINPQLLVLEDEEEGEKNESADKITVLTRYFRINGEVYCERGTKYSYINKPFPLCPDKSFAIDLLNTTASAKSKEQPQGREVNSERANVKGSKTPDDASVEESLYNQDAVSTDTFISPFDKIKATCALYPIVCGYYERREGSIYGISEVEGLIPNQKAINFNIAMSLLNAQQCAWGKYVALPNALKGQVISNSPGQVLVDYSGTGQGIKRMEEAAISGIPVEMSEKITELTRLCTGANEILSGEALKTNMSGVAIAQLQAQAEVPIEELRAELIRVKRKQGMVLAQFLRLYYFDRAFIRRKRDNGGNERDVCDRFTSDEYKYSVLDVIVEPTRGTRATITSDINLLDTCLKNGNISLETYIKSYPEGVITNKETILKQIQEEKSSEIEELRKEIKRRENSKTVDPVSIV